MLITGPAPFNTDHGPEFYLLQQQQIEIVAERKENHQKQINKLFISRVPWS